MRSQVESLQHLIRFDSGFVHFLGAAVQTGVALAPDLRSNSGSALPDHYTGRDDENTMKEHCRNIYQTARRTAGSTQEHWAEQIGVSVEAVRQYEGGIIMPSDEVVLRMAEVSGMLILPYWHLTRKSRIAAAILPELGEKRLPEAVLGLLTQIDDFREDGMRKLLRQPLREPEGTS